MTEVEFKPLSDDSSVVSIGGLAMENAANAVLVTGSLELSLDNLSVERARKLSSLFSLVADQIEAHLKVGVDDGVDEDAVVEIKNPFG